MWSRSHVSRIYTIFYPATYLSYVPKVMVILVLPVECVLFFISTDTLTNLAVQFSDFATCQMLLKLMICKVCCLFCLLSSGLKSLCWFGQRIYSKIIFYSQNHPLDTQYFDKHFTVEKAKLTPTDPTILPSIDQAQFQGFSYTNPNATDK